MSIWLVAAGCWSPGKWTDRHKQPGQPLFLSVSISASQVAATLPCRLSTGPVRLADDPFNFTLPGAIIDISRERLIVAVICLNYSGNLETEASHGVLRHQGLEQAE